MRGIGPGGEQALDDRDMAALGGDQQGGASAIVFEVDRGTPGEQELDGRKPLAGRHVVGMAGGPHEGGKPVRMALVDRDARIEQAADDRRMATRRGIDQGALAGGIKAARIGTVGEEEGHEPLVAVEGGGGERRHAASARLVHRRPALEQQLDKLRPVRLDRGEQRRGAGEAAQRRVGAVLEQEPGEFTLAGAGGLEECGLARPVADIDRSARPHELLGELETAAFGREGERLSEVPRARLGELGESALALAAALRRGRLAGAEGDQDEAGEREKEPVGEAPGRRGSHWPGPEASLMLAISGTQGRRGMALRAIGSVLLATTVLSGAALAASGYRIVANEKSSTLTVLDAEDKVIRTVPSCGRPRGMIFTPDRKQILVGCADDNVIAVYDVPGLELARRITNVAAPETFDLHPDGRHLYVSNEEDAQATVFDLETGEQVAAYDTGEEPEGVLATPDGRFVFVASEAANLVHVIDTAKQEVVKDIVTDTRPRRFALTPDGKELWVSAEVAGVVNVIDMSTLEVKTTIEFLPKGMRREMVTPVDLLITRDGKRAYVALGRANHVAVVDVASKRVTDYVLVGRRPWGLRLTRDEKLLYVANGLSDDITVIDTASLKALRSVPVGEVPYGLLIDD